ncbi:MAG: TIGR01777 family protein [Planctomycetaceae bacterium]|nr:TIGR01777 family protein [Planctomycetaceae bacterium]
MSTHSLAPPAPAVTPCAERTIAISGKSGLVGSAFASSFVGSDHRVLNVTRDPAARSFDDIIWDPNSGIVNPARLEGTDAFVHLAGENIATGRWTEAKKSRIRNSRVDGTRAVASTLARMDRKPSVLVCASAIGFYGDRGSKILDEYADAGTGFLADVCRDWEAATQPAEDAGIRVVHLRIGVIISRNGGALPQMLTPFKLGVGGRIGSGQQFWSWVSIDDVVGAIHHAIDDDTLRGAINCVAPQPVTNSEFTRMLGSVLRRPTVFPVPGFAARLALGEMANDLLLASTRVLPRRLETSGYVFSQPDLRRALESEIHAR